MKFYRINAKKLNSSKNSKSNKLKLIKGIFGAVFNNFSIDSDIKRIKLSIYVISLASISFVLFSIFKIHGHTHSTFENNYLKFFFITLVYLVLMIDIKSIIIGKVLFMYKDYFLNLAYELRNKISGKNDVDKELIFISNNGQLIGILEGFLFSFSIIVKNATLIGVILAIRSYVSISKSPNKEESEFYIIGILGSLLISILFTYLYIISIYSMLGIDIISIVNNLVKGFST